MFREKFWPEKPIYPFHIFPILTTNQRTFSDVPFIEYASGRWSEECCIAVDRWSRVINPRFNLCCVRFANRILPPPPRIGGIEWPSLERVGTRRERTTAKRARWRNYREEIRTTLTTVLLSDRVNWTARWPPRAREEGEKEEEEEEKKNRLLDFLRTDNESKENYNQWEGGNIRARVHRNDRPGIGWLTLLLITTLRKRGVMWRKPPQCTGFNTGIRFNNRGWTT